MRKAYRRRGGLRQFLGMAFALLIGLLIVYLSAHMLQDVLGQIRRLDPSDGNSGGGWAHIALILATVGFACLAGALFLVATLWRARHLLQFANESPMAVRASGRPYRFVEGGTPLLLQGLFHLSLGVAGGVMLAVGIAQLTLPAMDKRTAFVVLALGGVFLFASVIGWWKRRRPSGRSNALTIDLKGVSANWNDPTFVPWAAI